MHIRHRHESHFTVVGNHLAQHPHLSATALGVAVRIQSLPDGAKVGIKALADHFSEGEDRLAAALNELEAAGYLQRCKERAAGQRIVTRTTFYERPGEAAQPPVRRVQLTKRTATFPTRPHPTQEQRPQHRPTPEPPRYEPKPEPKPERGQERGPEPEPGPGPGPEPEPGPEPRRPVSPLFRRTAADLLAGLRGADARLTVSVRDVERLTPAVCAWLERGVPPEQVARTLSGALPAGEIRWPARLLAHRLSAWLPPALPTAPPPFAPATARPAPLRNCNGCDRAFRTTDSGPARCRDCRTRPAP
ncbi:helix-turn-helix domain-containing protein [Streptomyces sp. H27-D2]|uniref:helix-turn-helix domain-containing protein n=1 Tax=Streptomyces sp. H27-D2 TaxID=3046304 RepID=UPI002DBC0F20|nr:helix-turn-helix domain-containing protein [Streptomyces sp. H27-D2]MEC4015968.1 helix-turn-helix domain-containing protein [Streptomyces sp. H27-D2]